MKSIRKLSVLMALVTLFSVATGFAIPVSAETSNLNSHLVTYYDFEGSTTADQLRDKAPAGSNNEALAFVGTGASVRDGVATIPQDSGIYTNTVTDVAAITGDSMTVFLHFKADYVLNSAVWADLFKSTTLPAWLRIIQPENLFPFRMAARIPRLRVIPTTPTPRLPEAG